MDGSKGGYHQTLLEREHSRVFRIGRWVMVGMLSFTCILGLVLYRSELPVGLPHAAIRISSSRREIGDAEAKRIAPSFLNSSLPVTYLATNYAKWDKIAGDVESDSEASEPEWQPYIQKKAKFIHIPPEPWLGKLKFAKHLQEDYEFDPMGPQHVLMKYNWKYIGTRSVPGYVGEDKDRWHLYYDDIYLKTQEKENQAAQALLITECKGSFVIACSDKDTGKEKPISRKQVADLIERRYDGKEGKKIMEDSRDRKLQLESVGAKVIDKEAARKMQEEMNNRNNMK